jgi:hypothetical protein
MTYYNEKCDDIYDNDNIDLFSLAAGSGFITNQSNITSSNQINHQTSNDMNHYYNYVENNNNYDDDVDDDDFPPPPPPIESSNNSNNNKNNLDEIKVSKLLQMRKDREEKQFQKIYQQEQENLQEQQFQKQYKQVQLEELQRQHQYQQEQEQLYQQQQLNIKNEKEFQNKNHLKPTVVHNFDPYEWKPSNKKIEIDVNLLFILNFIILIIFKIYIYIVIIY